MYHDPAVSVVPDHATHLKSAWLVVAQVSTKTRFRIASDTSWLLAAAIINALLEVRKVIYMLLPRVCNPRTHEPQKNVPARPVVELKSTNASISSTAAPIDDGILQPFIA